MLNTISCAENYNRFMTMKNKFFITIKSLLFLLTFYMSNFTSIKLKISIKKYYGNLLSITIPYLRIVF